MDIFAAIYFGSFSKNKSLARIKLAYITTSINMNRLKKAIDQHFPDKHEVSLTRHLTPTLHFRVWPQVK